MTLTLCVIMDEISTINIKKDSTIALMQEAQRRQWTVYYTLAQDIFLAEDNVFALTSQIQLELNNPDWFTFLEKPCQRALQSFDIVFMRKDPPFNLHYLYTTYLLEIAQLKGSFVINNPCAIRDSNEKLFAAQFPQCCPETLVTSQKTLLRQFLETHQHIVVKRLNSMGGEAVFSLKQDAINTNVTFELLTGNGQYPIMAQRYLPEIAQGDKRILMIDGKPYPYALARIPAMGDFRGNLAAGAKGVGCELTARDIWLCEQIGPTLQAKGLFFVGVDVIGDFITEINVTSPTCIKEIEQAFQLNICEHILDRLQEKLR